MPQTATAVQRERRDVATDKEARRDLAEHFKEYAQENPSTCAMWCFFAGFVLGWKLKPW